MMAISPSDKEIELHEGTPMDFGMQENRQEEQRKQFGERCLIWGTIFALIVVFVSSFLLWSGYIHGQPTKHSFNAHKLEANLRHPGKVVSFPFQEKDYLPLPIQPLRKDERGKQIADALYPEDRTRLHRTKYNQERRSFIDANPKFKQLKYAKYNMVTDEREEREGNEASDENWAHLNAKYHISDFKQEPMCIVVTNYNNNVDYRIEYNLNSIFSQNYSNYKVVIMDDGSTDGSRHIYRNYLAFHRIDRSRYVYIQNKYRLFPLLNIYLGVLNYCDPESIVLLVEGKDQLIGRHILQLFSQEYQAMKSGVMYSNFLLYKNRWNVNYGFTQSYSDEERKNFNFRVNERLVPRFSHLRTFRAFLLQQLSHKDLQDKKGEFYKAIYDLPLILPLIELSCGRVHKIEDEYSYLYHDVLVSDVGDIAAAAEEIYSKKKSECSKEFEEKLKKAK